MWAGRYAIAHFTRLLAPCGELCFECSSILEGTIPLSDPLTIEREYQARLDAMAPSERVARSIAMFTWTCQQLARQITAEQGETREAVLKWKVALRLYGNEPTMREMIEQRLADVSD